MLRNLLGLSFETGRRLGYGAGRVVAPIDKRVSDAFMTLKILVLSGGVYTRDISPDKYLSA